MSIEFVANWITGFCEAYFLFIICETFMNRREKYRKYVYILGIICLGIIINIINMLFPVTVLNVIVVVFWGFIFTFLYCGKLRIRIISPILNFMLAMITEVGVLLLISLLYNMNASDIIAEGPWRILGIVLSKLLCYAAVKFVSFKFKREIVSADTNYWILFAIMFGTTTFTMFTFCKALEEVTNAYIRNLAIISSCGLGMATIITLFLYERTLRQKYLIAQNQLSELKLKEQVKHYDDIMMTQSEIKKVKHDLQNHLLSIKSQLDRREYSGCVDYVDTLLSHVDSERSYIDTGNTVLDAIISAKKTEAEKFNIKFSLNTKIPKDLPMAKEDECIIFGNALDNAIEACRKVDTDRYINMSLIFDKNSLMCKIVNSCANEEYNITSKNDLKNHGIGIRSMKNALNRYTSVSRVNQTENEYELFFIIMELNMQKT